VSLPAEHRSTTHACMHAHQPERCVVSKARPLLHPCVQHTLAHHLVSPTLIACTLTLLLPPLWIRELSNWNRVLIITSDMPDSHQAVNTPHLLYALPPLWPPISSSWVTGELSAGPILSVFAWGSRKDRGVYSSIGNM
jgi:hypothetical protein